VPALVRETAELGLSTLALGAALAALPPAGPPPAGQVAATGALLLVMCYCGGTVGRLSWGLAALEALLRLRLALAWCELLLEAFGSDAG
jgi:hypothetical protein